jgi:RHS repeat-associated protein
MTRATPGQVSPGRRTTYDHDANGNTTLVNAGGSVTTYCWDIENRMMLAELPSGGRTTATYDGDGKRRSYADSAGLRSFLWDGENIACETDGAGATAAAYSYGPSGYGALLSQRRSGATRFHHGACPERSRGDALGSTMQLTDASQTATDSYLYRAFGEQSVLSGSSPNPFTWVGRLGYYRQADTGDYWVRARVYAPARGRWVSRDPACGASQRYSYVYSRPGALVDPTGRTAEVDWGLASPTFSIANWDIVPRPAMRPYPRRGREGQATPVRTTTVDMLNLLSKSTKEAAVCNRALREAAKFAETDPRLTNGKRRYLLRKRIAPGWEGGYGPNSWWQTWWEANYIGGHVSYGRATARRCKDDMFLEFEWVLEDIEPMSDGNPFISAGIQIYGMHPGDPMPYWIDSSLKLTFRWKRYQFKGECYQGMVPFGGTYVFIPTRGWGWPEPY